MKITPLPEGGGGGVGQDPVLSSDHVEDLGLPGSTVFPKMPLIPRVRRKREVAWE